MHSVSINEVPLVPEGSVFTVSVGCRTFYSTDKDFVSSWLTKYLKDPQATEKEWYEQPWNQKAEEPLAETAQYTATEAAQQNLANVATPRGLGATLGRR